MRLKGLYLVTPDYIDESLFNRTETAIKNGVNILQYRDKSNTFKTRLYVARKLKKICTDYGIPFIIDDDPILMEIVDADGVHIGKDDVPFSYIKEKYPGRIIGVSTYGSIPDAMEYQKKGADYVAFGSFFSTHTKTDATMCDINILRHLEGINIPIFVIGGINMDNVVELLKYNISGIAVVSSIYSSPDIAGSVKYYISKLKEYKKI
ncbi:MAG: thiamine phosphate synthase [Ferroplasma sp.]